MSNPFYYLRGLGLALLLLARAADAQDLVKIEPAELADHRTGPTSVIHSKVHLVYPQLDYVTVQVIVAPDGSVESVQSVNGPDEFFSQAESIEAKRRFKPFVREGIPVRASFPDYISIVPPEQWAETNLPVPEIKDWNSLKIRLKRTSCYGPCPAYSVEIDGSGEVEFQGISNVFIVGHHRSQISKQATEDLVASFRRANYFSLKNEYVTFVTDNPSYITSLEFDGNHKSVRDYVGLRAGMPEVLTDLEDTIDRIAGTEKWVKGNQQTAAALLAEHWGSRTDSEENRVLFAKVVASGSEELTQLFISHGAPALSITKDGEGALVSAAEKGDLDLVKLMLAGHSKPPPVLLSCALGSGANSGNFALLQFLLEKGADPNGPACGKYGPATVLMRAATSGNAEIVQTILKYHPDFNAGDPNGFTPLAFFLVRSGAAVDTQPIVSLLLEAGADVNSRDSNEQTPIYYACSNQHPEAIHTLLASGADVNVRDRNGQTVLMSCFDNSSLKAIIDAGADLTAQNSFGRTAAEQARDSGALDKAALLEAAMKAKSQNH